MANEYESTLYEDKFVETVGKALKIIGSGMKPGADNVELMLTDREIHYLGPILDIINKSEIESKQGNNNKLSALELMLSDYRTGSDKNDLSKIFRKCQEL